MAFSHSSDIGFSEFKQLCRNFPTVPHSFLVIDITFPSNNALQFCKILLEEVYRVIKTIDVKIKP